MRFPRFCRGKVLRLLGCCLAIGILSPWNSVVEDSEVSAQSVALQPPECTTTQIKISEVEADPPLAGTDTTDEWFEVFNTGSECTMTGWTIVDNSSISDTLPTLRIAASGHVIVAATTSFDTNHPTFSGARVLISDGVIGGGTGTAAGLSNSGDVLRIMNMSGTEADCVSWGSNTSCLNPSVPQNTANTTATYQRTPTDGTDTDTNADWISATETPSGTPTAAFLASFTARSAKNRVLIRWETVNEFDVVGYNLLRSTSPDGPYAQINPSLLPAQGSGSVIGTTYSYADSGVSSGTTYYYILEVLNLDGSGTRFGPVSVRFVGLGLVEPRQGR